MSTLKTNQLSNLAADFVIDVKEVQPVAEAYTSLGAYGAGLVFNSYTETFTYAGVEHRPLTTLALPYTTTGAGAGEIASFRNIGDALLRSDLAASGGVDLVNGAIKSSASVAQIQSLAATDNAQTSLSDGRMFVFRTSDLSADVTADTQQWRYIAPSFDLTGASGAWVLTIAGEWQAGWFIKPSDTSFNAAVVQAQSSANPGQMLRLPDQTLTLSDAYTDKLQFIGNSKLSALKAGAGASRIIDFGRHVATGTSDWDYHEILNVNFDGNLKVSDGVAFNDSDVTTDEFGGRWSFQNCRFARCKKAVFQETGNIGNRYLNTSFFGNDFGIYAISPVDNAIMHTGAMVVSGGEFNGSAKAAIFINDDQDGTGGFTFKDIVIENSAGFGIFMNLNGVTPYSGVVFDNVWFEDNHNAATVEIDAVTYTPRDIRLDNVVAAEFRNMFLSSVELNNSTVVASNCRIDDSAISGRQILISSDSSLICDGLFAQGSTGGEAFVRSIAKQRSTSGNANLSVRGPLATSYLPTSGALLYGNNFDGAGPWSFVGTTTRNATSVADGVISGSCAEILINNGETLIGPDNGTPTVGKWAVWGIHAKLVSGNVATASLGYNYTFGDIYLKQGQWVRSYGIQKVGGPVAGESRIYFVNNTGSTATIRLADHYVIEFDTFEEAIQFCNAGAAVRI